MNILSFFKNGNRFLRGPDLLEVGALEFKIIKFEKVQFPNEEREKPVIVLVFDDEVKPDGQWDEWGVTQDELDTEEFRLTLNKTNADKLLGWFGMDTDAWINKNIILKSVETEYKGKPTYGIRIVALGKNVLKEVE